MRIMIKGGVWKNAEDEILKAAVMKYGLNQWARISSLLTRKSAKQCKARWYEWLDPSIKKTEWTREEDEKLLHLAKVMPTQWRSIAPLVGRTPQFCLERYEKLLDQVMHKDGDYDPADDPRRLRPGEVDPNPESRPARPDPVDMDEDEKEMLAEARARMANTRGKKAKRKAREAQLEEARRLASLQKKRELKAAGIELKGRAKRRRNIDYNEEVPFELRPQVGFYDTAAEQEATRNLSKEFRPVSIDELEGRRRRDLEAQLIKEDLRKHNERKATDLPGVLAQQAALHDTGAPARRTKMMLPAPAVSENELALVAASMREGAGAELGAGGAATQQLLGQYQTPGAATGMLRTPLRTPAGTTSRVLAEAAALAHVTNLQTPLLGESSQLHISQSDFADVAPTASALPTPSILGTATPGAAAGARAIAGVAATPGRKGAAPPGGLAATPLRDELGLNTPDAGTPLPSKRAERLRRDGLRDAVRSGLAALPGPQNEYQLELPEAPDEGGAMDEGVEEDAADVEARRRAAAEAAAEEGRQKRSAVLRRKLPRPVTAGAAVLPGSAAFEKLSLREKAAATLHAEEVAILRHDLARYPLEQARKGKKAKKLKPQDDPMQQGPTPFEAEFDLDARAEAAQLVEEEAQLLRVKYGHADVTEEALIEAMDAASKEYMYSPEAKAMVKVAAASAEERVAALKAMYGALKESMIHEFDVAKKLGSKVEIVIKGHVLKDVELARKLRAVIDRVASKETELACFQELERREAEAIPRRKDELEDRVLRQRAVEVAQQERYKQLLARVDDARAALAAASS